MDIDGDKGGQWRSVQTLFKNRGMSSTQDQFKFSVPNCGSLARDVAIRIVAKGQGDVTASENHACYFMMNPVAIEPPTQPTTTVQPTTAPPRTTVQPPTTTTDRVITTQPTDPAKTSISSLPQSSPLTPGVSGSSSMSVPLSSGSGGSLTTATSSLVTRPYPSLPPLPPIPDDDGDITSNGTGSGGIPRKAENTRDLTAILGGICGGGAVVLITTLFVLRHRRQTRRKGQQGLLRGAGQAGGYGGLGRGMKGKRSGKNSPFKGNKRGSQGDRDFFLMRDDDEEDYDYDEEVAAATAGYRKSRHDLINLEAGPMDKSRTTSQAVEGSDQQQSERSAQERDSTVSYPPNAYLEPYNFRRPTSSNQYTYTDDDFTMSSMRSSCETSSVVRQYWAASMAARTERQLEGFPARRCFEDGYGSPSMSSQSRKADILSMDASLDGSFSDAVLNSIAEEEARSTVAAGGAPSRRRPKTASSYRGGANTRRSMTMSFASRQSTVSSDDDSYRHGFRPSINGEYLDHLNIKALRSEQHQLAYYKHFYRQNPTLTMSTAGGAAGGGGKTKTMTTTTTRRTSSAPSLTSTNDPFKNFDSDEIVITVGQYPDMYLDYDPFADQDPFSDQYEVVHDEDDDDHILMPPPPLLRVTNATEGAGGGGEERSNSALLRSFPIPPVPAAARSSSA